MGGGAAITWELELESFHLDFKQGKVVPAEKPEIRKWLAEDYLNCMDNIRPDLLRIVSVEIDDPQKGDELPDWYGELWAEMNGNKLKAMSGGGYTRGPWQDYFPLTFTGQMHVAYYGDLNITVIATYRNKREFDLFYRRLFECYTFQPSEATMDRKYGGLEGWYRWQWDRMEDWYMLR